MDNKLQVKALLDSSQFDQQISELQRKIKNLRETGPGGTFANLAQNYRSQGNEQAAQRIEAYRQRQDASNRMSIQNDYKKQEQMLQRMISLEERIAARIAEKGKATKFWVEQQEKLNAQIAQTSSLLNNMQKSDALGIGGGAGGAGGGAGGGNGLFSLLGNAKILAGLGTALGTAGTLYKSISRYPETLTQREAQIASFTSEGARLASRGRGYEMSLYAPERMRALSKASNAVRTEEYSDALKTAGLGVAGWGAGRLVGSAIGTWAGGTLGSVVPGLGTVAGAAVGNWLGGWAGGTIGSAGAALFDNKRRSQIFDRDAYQKELGAIFSGTYQQQMDAEKAKNYKVGMAADFFDSNKDNFRSLQRKFGMSDAQLFHGENSLLWNSANKGYGMGDISNAMMGISGAGGNTSVAINGAIEAAKLQRNLGITNAPQLLGRISGSTGANEIKSKDEIIRMYAEGTRIGLDSSEIKDYMQTVTDNAYKNGGDLQSIAGLLSSGIQGTGLNSTRGIEASQNALERLKNQTSERGGLTGQYKMSYMSSKGLNTGEMAYMSDLSIDQIQSDPHALRILEKHNIKPEDFMKEITRSSTKRDATIAAAEKWMSSKEKLSKMTPGTEEYEKIKKETTEGHDLFLESLATEGVTFKNKHEKEAFAEMDAAAMTGRIAQYNKSQQEYEKFKEKAEKEDQGAVSKSDRSAAKDQSTMFDILDENIKKLTTAFDENAGLTAQARKASAELAGLADILVKLKQQNPDAVKDAEAALKAGGVKTPALGPAN